MVLNAVDGTKIMARSSRRKMVHREDLEKALAQLDEVVNEVMDQVERAEQEQTQEYTLPQEMQDPVRRREASKRSLEMLDEVVRDHLHLGEPDSRLMKAGRAIDLCYNAQVVADHKSGIIVAQAVVNDENDTGQLAPMLEKVKETLADGGYASGEQIDLAEKAGLSVLTHPSGNEPSPKGEEKPYHASKFVYDQERDV